MGKGISIHVGLNSVDPRHYQGWSGPLTACEFDANDMQALAASRGFKTVKLLTKAAKRTKLMSEMSKAAKALKSGDFLFLTYSGHGGQLPDANGDEQDAQDETWCLFDGELLDDELNFLFSKFKKGVRIFVLSDSCHSGTVTRDRLAEAASVSAAGRKLVYRAMPREQCIRTYMAHRKFYDGIQRKKELKDPQIAATVLLISGCQDNQLSLDGDFNGLFTAKLKSVWNGGAFTGNYRKMHKSILDQMPSTQTPNYYFVGTANPRFEAEVPFKI